MDNARGVLSDRDIHREINAGNIVIYDPEKDCADNIQNCSVDVTLGKWHFRANPATSVNQVLNPFDPASVHTYWGRVIEAKSGYIELAPGEMVLAHTNEFIGGLNHITTMMRARSTMSRSGVEVCGDAGWGDIGFYNRWSLRLKNNSSWPVKLPVKERVGQIIFMYTGIPDKVYQGQYQKSTDLGELVKNWTPDTLLPKLPV